MKITANSIRAGHILVVNGVLWIVCKTPEHVKPGKGPAYLQIEMKNLKTGTKLNDRFSSSDYVEKAQLEQRDYNFIYPEDDKLVFMDNETFEQILLPKSILGERLPFLIENMNVKIEFHGEEALSVQLPLNVTLAIVETEPVIKGATATSTYKPAILENGARVMIPPYIETGTKIVVRTEDITFVERAK